ncbi:hypothetical protein [Pseudoalteromonas luteoviolacea]|uniref:hypothetical protein n=1 Tax=Pseudoalteromonas luteoviolacea TaxID=43657 RepID=UPI0011508BC0|nr:hypothetical protein [Pseudoalteromonas luteoviolacea]TQF67697.1 hypothetical protein FLM44_21190 [Pseudoalteromonas luteoviolacea]
MLVIATTLLSIFISRLFLQKDALQKPNTQASQQSQQAHDTSTTFRKEDKIPEITKETDQKPTATLHRQSQLTIIQKPTWKLKKRFYDAFSDLKAAAHNGDANANYIIGANLRFCLSAPIDEYALQSKLDEVSSYSDADRATDNLIEKFNYCDKISSSERNQFFSYIETAAHSGSIAAQETYAAITPKSYMDTQGFTSLPRGEYIEKRDAFIAQQVTFLNQAAKRGSERALQYLSRLYHTQSLTENSLANSYAINRVIMELTNNDKTYNRYAWYEQRQYQQLSAEELDSANEIFDLWLAAIYSNGTFYPSNRK